MATVLKIGPADHDRPMSYDEFIAGDYEEGYRYELIDGRLYVSPGPGQPHEWVEKYLFRKLTVYSEQRPDVINYLVDAARVFVPSAKRTTCPEPDLAAYRDFPRQRGPYVDWDEVSPILVVEVLGEDSSEKDLIRNVELYFRVPSIQEYWVADLRADAGRPTLLVYRRASDGWDQQTVEFGGVYRTDLLPGFELLVDPLSDERR